MSKIAGKDATSNKILPILIELLKDDNSEVKHNVVTNLFQVAIVQGQDFFSKDMVANI
jgi:hypothetical protein